MGKLIVLEGIDGSGKSTQFKLLCDRLASEGRDFMRIRFPRYDEPSSALIKMYLEGQFGQEPDAVNAYAASSFFAVDRIASFLLDWRDYYELGGLVLTDRYTTSNAIHQGAKLPAAQREDFFEWLHDYEYNLLRLPSPELVVYMDIGAQQAALRLQMRQSETGTGGDIHEADLAFLEKCTNSGSQAAAYYGWYTITCLSDGYERSKGEIHQEIFDLIMEVGL